MPAVTTVKESKSAATIRRRRNMVGPSAGKPKSREDELDLGEDPEPEMKDAKIAPQVLRLLMSSEKKLFMGLVAFRIVNALMLHTSFVPDEYWQSLEVAHKMAFGYGHLTWEWHQGLRSYTYPTIFALLYKALGMLRLDYRVLLIKLPRIIQAVFAALGDFYLFKLSWKLSSQQVALWTLLCQLTSWFTFYCATRTLTNSMETVLTTVALFYFPWPGKPRKAMWKYMCLVALAMVIRPTAAIIWIPLCVWHVILYKNNLWRVLKLFAKIGVLVLLLSSLIDRACYGKWVNVHYNFLEFNVLSNLGAFYGSHPWHWYLSQGFLIVMGTHIFPFILGAVKGMEKALLAVILWTIAIYSLLEHKEFRFLFPILPLTMHVCGQYLHYVCDSEDTGQNPSISRRKLAVVLLIATNLPVALYTSLLHQRGTVDVMKHLHDDSFKNDPHFMDVLFLMPCHSTPYYSYLHRNISLQFLTCEPNLAKDPDYIDEADIFYANPEAWLNQKFPTGVHHVPSHLALFNVLQPKIKKFLDKHGYIDCARFFHSHVPEGRVGSHVVVKCQVEWKVTSSMQDLIMARAEQYKASEKQSRH